MTTQPDPTAPITDPVQLRHAALDHIKADPDSWNQTTWRCSSGMCFAGWAAQLAGGTFLYGPEDLTLVQAGDLLVNRQEIVVTPTGDTEAISEFAQAALELTTVQAAVLFDSDNTLDDLERLVSALDRGADITGYRTEDDEIDDSQDHVFADDYTEGLGSL